MKFREPIALTLVFVLASCSAAQVREESYTPSKETLRIKSDMPIVGIYDRWEDKADSRYLVDGKAVIASNDLVTLLSDDPSAEVVSKVKAHESWKTAGQVSATAAFVAALVAAVGYIRDKDTGERGMSISTINVFWGITAVAAAFSGASYLLSDQSLRDAVPIHNDHIPKTAMGQGTPPVMVTWEARF